MTSRGPEEDAGEPFDVDPGTAYPARIFDYLLGGQDHFAADRDAAHHLYSALPGGVDTARRIARIVHTFVVDAVRYLAEDAGIRQFLNIGNVVRIPDNVHEVAQRVAPDACVVYVVSDPVVLAHAHRLRTTSAAGSTTVLPSDLRDLRVLMQQAAATLDFGQPVGLLVSGVLHYVSGRADPYKFLAQLVDPLAPGSHVVVSHAASDISGQMAEMTRRQEELTRPMRWPLVPRNLDEVARFFDGLELVDPGVVPIDQWHPPSASAASAATSAPTTSAPSAARGSSSDDSLPWYAALARKPG